MSKEKHQTFERLLSAAREVNAEISGPQKLADAMNESAQTVTNWGTRGVSAKAAAKAAETEAADLQRKADEAKAKAEAARAAIR